MKLISIIALCIVLGGLPLLYLIPKPVVQLDQQNITATIMSQHQSEHITFFKFKSSTPFEGIVYANVSLPKEVILNGRCQNGEFVVQEIFERSER